jgi:hypothetical protein
MPPVRVLFIIILAIGLTVQSYAATYKGKNIDGKKYAAVVSNDSGLLVSADVRFDGMKVFIYFGKRTHTAFLSDEAISDPRNVLANDGHHVYTIEIRDKL